MMNYNPISFFWFRRDLRLDDNIALWNALQSKYPVIPVFIFDDEILDQLPKEDARVTFIYENLQKINSELSQFESSILIRKGKTQQIWSELIEEYATQEVFYNKDYEPYALQRDLEISALLQLKKAKVSCFKDHVIYEQNEISKGDGSPYTIYTPYKNKWIEKFEEIKHYPLKELKNKTTNFFKSNFSFPSLKTIGFIKSTILVKEPNLKGVATYETTRNFPALDSTSYLSPHLRFGTVSIRKLAHWASHKNSVFLNELIWREFFMQILFHFPYSVNQNFKSAYDSIQWRNDPKEFKLWCEGKTGYPMVDAGMRQLNKTGYMHNRVRMVVASFLCKHLLINWQWGEAYFAEKLLDFELASNVGNWQWAAGTGCDSAPYFRVFNPEIQLKKFDCKGEYIRQWIPEFDLGYKPPMVEHAIARERALSVYKAGIKQ